MPNFNPANALRGADGVREAAERKGGGGEFTPFCPEIQWRDNDEEKYVLFLTPVDELLGFLTHEWVKVGTGTKSNGETYTKYEWFFSRKDPAIGEDHDELADRLDNQPKLKTFGVAVELEPVFETGRGGRQKVTGFEVATSNYNRKGEDDETIEVTKPEVGVVMQSSQNFWGSIVTFQEKRGEVTETAFQVIRKGKDANTDYEFFDFLDVPIDLSNLIEYIDGVSYLAADPEFEGVLAEAAEADDDLAAAVILGEALLNRRLNELADKERYDELVKPIEELPQRYGKKGAKGKKQERPARPARTSRRAAKAEDAPAEAPEETKAEAEAPAEAPAEETPAKETKATEKAADKGDRFAKLRARAEAK